MTIFKIYKSSEVVDSHKILFLRFDNLTGSSVSIASCFASWKTQSSKDIIAVYLGAEKGVLLRVHRSLIRARLDCCCFIYISASKTTLKALDTISNKTLLIYPRAFISSLYTVKLMHFSYVCEGSNFPLVMLLEFLLILIMHYYISPFT